MKPTAFCIQRFGEASLHRASALHLHLRPFRQPVPVRDKLGYYTRQFEYDADTWPEITSAPGFRLLEQRFFTGMGEAGWREVEGPADLAHQTAWLTPHATGVAVAALERLP